MQSHIYVLVCVEVNRKPQSVVATPISLNMWQMLANKQKCTHTYIHIFATSFSSVEYMSKWRILHTHTYILSCVCVCM